MLGRGRVDRSGEEGDGREEGRGRRSDAQYRRKIDAPSPYLFVPSGIRFASNRHTLLAISTLLAFLSPVYLDAFITKQNARIILTRMGSGNNFV